MASPLVTSLVATKTKISDEIGMNQSTLTFAFDQNIVEFTVNLDGSAPTNGTVLDSAVENVGTVKTQTVATIKTQTVLNTLILTPTGTGIDSIIYHTDLTTEGLNRINVYGKNTNGEWTPYG